jgi:hypothetical protein
MSSGDRARSMATSSAAKAGVGEGQAQESIGCSGAATRRGITAPVVEQGLAVAIGSMRKRDDDTTTRRQGDR